MPTLAAKFSATKSRMTVTRVPGCFLNEHTGQVGLLVRLTHDRYSQPELSNSLSITSFPLFYFLSRRFFEDRALFWRTTDTMPLAWVCES
ncbi:hypothetical protein FA15DRAFT_78548 [Coprinopsis marcescibilis]|uniref:Uncharacterized protein n=1 Tax=Coprinopsis marcescibilis TaxID=230819 RepID=A0A5C3KNP4_COPMA|nr:hypothetical protein FA15DRAFT_78548 [Coprinopsis marcescibilis]